MFKFKILLRFEIEINEQKKYTKSEKMKIGRRLTSVMLRIEHLINRQKSTACKC
jgi:hypothetical protein